ncbi:aminotransferase class I/II-fold pyridoxal phosphate-dependent enzyme [Leptonema illini]|uniref:Aminotransferase class I and II n=1 Tax=Leptonema illini DSM 21528 TaxID=929563 RepID=H2CJQ2_9LEPT|nr:8-amino-7-oxononanoate synthase [Leptonema illini]EHQ08213.1 aminotransferase class I and II [Leptonema illini DSM 21528]
MQSWRDELQQAVTEREHRRLLRRLETSPAGSVDFSSNDYLSLNSDGTVKRLFESLLPLSTQDLGSTGSRLIRGHREAFDRAERAFADWVGLDGALLFHSGYAGNVGTLQALLSPGDLVFADRLCHASLLDGIRLSGATRHYFRHNDLEHLSELLRKHSTRKRRWIVTESVFSMDGDRPDRDALLALAEQNDCLLYLDEAHAIGVIGEAGRGLAHPEQQRFAVLSYPMGKAPGLMGCFVAGPPELKAFLVNHARSFIYSTAQPPLLADLLRLVIEEMGTDEMEKRRIRLRKLSELLFKRLNEEGFATGVTPSHITPIILGAEERTIQTATRLKQQGFSVFAIRPPTVPAGACRLRISVHAGNTEEEIEGLVTALRLSR